MSTHPDLPPSQASAPVIISNSGSAQQGSAGEAAGPAPVSSSIAGTGNRGPLLILGGVLLCAGLILHFDRPGAGGLFFNSRSSVENTGSGGQGGAAAGNEAARSSPAGGSAGAQPQGIGHGFLGTAEYKAALEVAGMADTPMRTEAMEALIETWVASSPSDAADWAGSLPAGNFRDDAMSALMFHWGLSAPAEAAAWMARTGVDDPEAASALACRWAASDPSSASSWAENIKDNVMRQDAIAGVAGAWGERAPESAATWVATLPAHEKELASATLTAAWSATAPAAAAAWLANQKDAGKETQTAALAVLTTNWAEQSPGAASRFLNTLPEGPVRDAAASQFAVAAAPAAPAEALAWAMNLEEPAQRNQVVTDATESWYDGAPEGFRAGISDALSLMDDPEMRKSIYEMLYNRDPGFHDNLLKLVEPSAPATPSAVPGEPFTPEPAATPVPVSAPETTLSAPAPAVSDIASTTAHPSSERPTVSPLIPGTAPVSPAYLNSQSAAPAVEVQSGNLLPTTVTIKRGPAPAWNPSAYSGNNGGEEAASDSTSSGDQTDTADGQGNPE